MFLCCKKEFWMFFEGAECMCKLALFCSEPENVSLCGSLMMSFECICLVFFVS